MTHTRKEALEALLEKVEAGTADNPTSPGCHGKWPFFDAFPPHETTDHELAINAYEGSLDAAKALHEAVLPGWGYRICECYLTDDAAVFPDFNCPEHGPRLRATLDEGFDWFSFTDVDQRPAGNPARALLRSILKALIAQEG